MDMTVGYSLDIQEMSPADLIVFPRGYSMDPCSIDKKIISKKINFYSNKSFPIYFKHDFCNFEIKMKNFLVHPKMIFGRSIP